MLQTKILELWHATSFTCGFSSKQWNLYSQKKLKIVYLLTQRVMCPVKELKLYSQKTRTRNEWLFIELQ